MRIVKISVQALWLALYAVLLAVSSFLCRQAVYSQYPQPYYEETCRASELTGVELHLIYSVMKAESGFDPEAVSQKKASGLMQLADATARDMARLAGIGYETEDLLMPAKNILLGSCYLAWLLDRYSGDLRMTLAAYNAGPGKVTGWQETHPELLGYGETRVFVNRVLEYRQRYRRLYP